MEYRLAQTRMAGTSLHVMFADDTILLAASKLQQARMIADTKRLLAVRGLKLSSDKCVVQTNDPTVDLVALHVAGEDFPMASAEEGFKVLGTQLTLLGRTTCEVKACISAAWSKLRSGYLSNSGIGGWSFGMPWRLRLLARQQQLQASRI